MNKKITTQFFGDPPLILLFIVSIVGAVRMCAAGDLYWNPSGTTSITAGGSGTWAVSPSGWVDSLSSPITWVTGTGGTILSYDTLHFGADEQGDASYSVSIASGVGDILVAGSATLTLDFQGNYNFLSQNNIVIGGTGGNAYLNIAVEPGKSVMFNGTDGALTFRSDGSSSDIPGIKLSGGGNIDFTGDVEIRTTSNNSRITIGDAGDAQQTTLTLSGTQVLMQSARLFLDNSRLVVNGASIVLNNTNNHWARSTLQIGSTAVASVTNQPSMVTLNSGTIRAYTAVANVNVSGVQFGAVPSNSALGYSGGTFNLNGGLLETTDIVNGDATGNTMAHFIFNGGTLAVHSTASATRLARFISGFDGHINRSLEIKEGGAFIDTSNASTSGTATISSALTGSGGLTKLGAKGLRLAAANTYTGTTTISGGVLELGAADAIAPSAGITIAADAALDAGGLDQTLRHLSGSGLVAMGAGDLTLANTAASIFSGSITREASAALTKTGAGTLILGAGANLGGGITVGEGGLQGSATTLASALTGGAAIDTGADGRVIFDIAPSDAAATYAGAISGAGKIEKIGTGTLTLSTAQTYTGGVIATAGALRGSTENLHGNIALAAPATVIFDQAAAGTHTGTIAGAGTFEKSGTAALTLAAASQHTGTTRLLEGTLAVSTADALAASSRIHLETLATLDFGGFDQTLRNLTGGGTLAMGAGSLTAEVTADTTTTFAGIIEGSGGLTKTGAGSLILAGANTFSGNVTVATGALFIDSAAARLTGDITVAPQAAFGGAGAVGAAGKTLALDAGGTLQIGTPGSLSAQTLTVNSNLLFTNATLAVDLFNDNTSDRLLLGLGAILTASGSNTIDIGAFTSGTFNLGNIAALKTDSAALTITLRGQSAEGGRQSVASGTTASGELVLTTIASKSREMVWTGSAGSLWDTAGTGWDDRHAPGEASQFASGDRVIFDGVSDAGYETNRHITIDGAYVTVSDLIVRGDASYAFDGAAIIADADSVIDVPGTLTGATGKLLMQGTGTLTLAPATGTNHFKGGVELHSGVLALDSLGALGDSALAVTGEAAAPVTLRIESNAHGIQLGGPIDLGSKGLTLDTQAHDATLAGALTGAAGGDLIKTGAGALTLAAAGDYLGATDIREGTLRAGADYAFAHSSSVHIAAGATLDLNDFSQRAGDLHGAGLVTLGTSAATLLHAVSTSDTEFSGTLAGAGSFAKDGAATLTLGGPLGHTGTTAVLAGTLRLTTADALATSAAVAIDTAGTLDLNDQNQTLKNLQGSGTLIHGTAVLTLESTEDTEFPGVLAASAGGDTGSLIKTGTAALTLGGANAFTGGATIASGTVIARHIAALGRGPITLGAAGAGLRFDGAVGELAQTLTGAGHTIDFTGGSRVRLSAANTLAGLRASGAGTVVTAAHPGALGGPAASVGITDHATLEIAAQRLRAGNVTVSGGTLLFALDHYGVPFQNFTVNSLKLENQALIAFGGPVATGRYYLANGAAPGAIDIGRRGADYIYNAVQYGVRIDIDENGELIAYNQSINPSKDVAAAFDSMIASMNAVHSRIGEAFLIPLVERTINDRSRNFWFKAVGSAADYESDAGQAGHRDNAWGSMVGYDYVSADNRRMMGAYVGMGGASIDTASGASVDGDQQFAGLYASSYIGSVMYIGTTFGGAWMDSDTARHEGTGKTVGHYDIDSITASLELGAILRLWDTGALRPAATLHYMNAKFKDHQEGGVGAVDIDDFSQDVWQSLVSLQAFQEFELPWGWAGIIDVMIGWRQTLDGGGCRLAGVLAADKSVTFDLSTDGYTRGSVVLGFGSRFAITEHAILGFGYEYEVTGNLQRHTLNGSVRITW